MDVDGNVYLAIYGQGRALVFNRNGMPIWQILLPGRDDSHNLGSPTLVIKPGTNDIFILTNDWDGGQGVDYLFTRLCERAQHFTRNSRAYAQ